MIMKSLTFLFYFTVIWALISIFFNLGVIAYSISLSQFDGLFQYVIYYAINIMVLLSIYDLKDTVADVE